MEQSFRIDSILPDLRNGQASCTEMNGQSCYYESKTALGSFTETRDLLALQNSAEDDKKGILENGVDLSTNCRKRTSSAASDVSKTDNSEEDDSYNRKKKARTAFSRDQVMELEKKFQEKKYLSSSERGELAEKLKLSDMQVKTWFQNRRMKLKRQVEEAEMELKSPKYPFAPLMPFSGMSTPFYNYNPMMAPYKPDCFSFPPRPAASSMTAGEFPLALPSPPYPGVPNSNFYQPRRPLPGAPCRNSFFQPNAAFTPPSPSTQPYQLSGDTCNPINSSPLQIYQNQPPQVPQFGDWQRALPTPPTP